MYYFVRLQTPFCPFIKSFTYDKEGLKIEYCSNIDEALGLRYEHGNLIMREVPQGELCAVMSKDSALILVQLFGKKNK